MSANEEILIRATLSGTQEYLAKSQQVVAANEEIAASTDMIGGAAERTTRRGFLMNQMMFTARRLVYGTSLAFIGAGVAAVKWGFDFNSAMQTARVALAPLQSSTFSVNKELDYLFNFTKHTPFQFKDVTTAFRVLYGSLHLIGVSADTTNKTIKSITDSLAFAGKTSPGQLNKVATALQHMAFMGHVTGQVINQLNRDGLPATAVLQKEFGLTGDQIHKVGTLGIPTLEFLKRFNQFIATTPGYTNAAYRLSIHSLSGLFTTFKDNLSQLMGAIELGFFHKIQSRLVTMNQWFDKIQAAGKEGSLSGIIKAIGGSGALLIWDALVRDLHQFWVLFSTLTSTLTHSKPIWATIYLALSLIDVALMLINPGLQAFGGLLLYFLIPALVAWWTVTKLAAFWNGALALEEALATKATGELTFVQFLAAIATGRFQLAAKAAALWTAILTVAENALFIASSRVIIVVTLLAARMWLTTIATRALAFGVGLLKVAFGEEAIVAASAWAVTLAPIALITLAVIALAGWLYLVVTRFNEIKNAFEGLPKAAYDVATGRTPLYKSGHVSQHDITQAQLGGGSLPSLHSILKRIPGLAGGGSVLSSGYSWVGEQGPELLSLPVGASVTPRRDVFNMPESWMGGGGPRTVIAKVFLDKRQIAEAVADIEDEQGARA